MRQSPSLADAYHRVAFYNRDGLFLAILMLIPFTAEENADIAKDAVSAFAGGPRRRTGRKSPRMTASFSRPPPALPSWGIPPI